MKLTTPLLGLSLTVLVVACAGQPKTNTTAKKEATREVDPSTTETGKFRALPYTQRAGFMKTEVMPKMTEVFRAFDATHFTKVTCGTCHGPGAKDERFDMPTASLPALDFSAKDAKHQRWNAFMRSKVVPVMATTLGAQPYDPATKKGFGCLSCHIKAEK